MDFELYGSQNSKALLEENSPESKASWNIPSDGSMDNNDEYFGWANSLKIGEDKYDSQENKVRQKRKLSSDESGKVKSGNAYKTLKDPLEIDASSKQQPPNKKAATQNGTSRMPQWQVDDISDLNADIEGSLHLSPDIANNSYNVVGDAILSISGLTVFKQEAPSPTSHDVGALQVSRQNHQSPTSTQGPANTNNASLEDSSSNQNMINNTLHQLLGHSGYSSLQNALDGNLITSSTAVQQDTYSLTSTTCTFTDDCRFQYVLAAATSIATKINEDTLTYLNQGQSYEIKLKKLGDLSAYKGKMLKSIIRICFHERRLQYMEKEQMTLWQRSRPGDRILEIDVPLSYGLFDVVQPASTLNAVQFSWDPTKEVGVYIKVNCISTEFTPKKHGGEKGVPFRIQVETYQNEDAFESPKRLHAAACQIKVFKLKGADRKHKQDREKILKRPLSEQEKYQPSYECTVLNDIPNDAVVTTSSPRCFSPDSGTQNRAAPVQAHILPRPADDARNVQEDMLSSDSATLDNYDNKSKANTNTQVNLNDQLPADATPQQTTAWLTHNRFSKYLQTFNSFAGADLLRMSRDDLIQICGDADGIRLYNALNSKLITPKLTLYVCRENTSVFNAIFLSAFNYMELLQKLGSLYGVPLDQVRDIYMQGPQSIHIQLNNDVLRHLKEESMFTLQILEDDNGFVFVLKPSNGK